jgi:hypothetical protein
LAIHRIALVSCVKSKLATTARADQLYTSPWFRASRRYAERQADEWYILSAEYGLLRPEKRVRPYEKTLNNMGQADRKDWALRVQKQLLASIPANAEVIILAGQRYREHLVPFLLARGNMVSIPMEGLSIGRQLRFLKLAGEAAA